MIARLAVVVGVMVLLLGVGVPAASARIDLDKVTAFALVLPLDDEEYIQGIAFVRPFPASRSAQFELYLDNLAPGARYYWDIRSGPCDAQTGRPAFGNPGNSRFLVADRYGRGSVTLMLRRGSDAVAQGGYSVNIYPRNAKPGAAPAISCGDIEPVTGN